MANADKTLKNKDQLDIYPITRERNVYDENNVNLKTKFENVVFNDNDVHKFAEELYEESANEWYTKDKFISDGGIVFEIKDGGVYCSGTSTSGRWRTITLDTPLKPGRYAYKMFQSGTKPSNRGWDLRTSSGETVNLPHQEEGFVTIPIEVVSVRIYMTEGYSFENYVMKPMFVEEQYGIPTTFNPYNPNRHITNSEAEYLKEEFGKQENLLDVKTSSLTKNGITVSYNENTNSWSYSGTTTSTSFYIALPVSVNLDATKTYTLFRDRTLNNNIATQITKQNVSNNGTVEPNKTSIKLTNLNVGIPDAIMIYTNSIEVGTTINGEFKLSLIEGENFSGSFNKYNSASHITNPQADLLKSEWEKGVNLANIKDLPSVSRGGITYSITNSLLNMSGTTTEDVFITLLDTKDIIKSGKLYSVYSSVPYNSSKFNVSVILQYTDGSVEYIIPNTPLKVKDNLSTSKLALYCPSGNTYNYSNVGFMIYEGDKKLPYQPYNGQIIHEKDIEPVLLWENGNPGSNFTEQTITLSENIRNYKYCILKYTTEPNRGAKFIKLGVIYSDYQITDSYPDETPKVYFKSRRFIINGNQIQVGKGVEFNGTSASFKENAIIPLAIYGSNY